MATQLGRNANLSCEKGAWRLPHTGPWRDYGRRRRFSATGRSSPVIFPYWFPALQYAGNPVILIGEKV